VPSEPLNRTTMSHRMPVALAFVMLSLACTDRMTPSRAGTIIRHSRAFLSGSPETHPVFDGVTNLLTGSQGSTSEQQNGNSCIAEFAYHWPRDPLSRDPNQHGDSLKAQVILIRRGSSWFVDDDRSRALLPSWPQLPRTPNPFSPAAEARP